MYFRNVWYFSSVAVCWFDVNLTTRPGSRGSQRASKEGRFASFRGKLRRKEERAPQALWPTPPTPAPGTATPSGQFPLLSPRMRSRTLCLPCSGKASPTSAVRACAVPPRQLADSERRFPEARWAPSPRPPFWGALPGQVSPEPPGRHFGGALPPPRLSGALRFQPCRLGFGNPSGTLWSPSEPCEPLGRLGAGAPCPAWTGGCSAAALRAGLSLRDAAVTGREWAGRKSFL